jgi:hypothetical protein
VPIRILSSLEIAILLLHFRFSALMIIVAKVLTLFLGLLDDDLPGAWVIWRL